MTYIQRAHGALGEDFLLTGLSAWNACHFCFFAFFQCVFIYLFPFRYYLRPSKDGKQAGDYSHGSLVLIWERSLRDYTLTFWKRLQSSNSALLQKCRVSSEFEKCKNRDASAAFPLSDLMPVTLREERLRLCTARRS